MHFEKPDEADIDPEVLSVLKNAKIAIVVPAYNEEVNLALVIDTIPDYCDRIIVVDDLSTDTTTEVAKNRAAADDRVVLIRHTENQGVGGAIASGYEWARDNGMDCAVVMAGDGQMDPAELPSLLVPCLVDGVNYVKGNRLIYQQSRHIIPTYRFFGNSVLSLLTKIASGYWHVSDSQCGYTVVDRKVLERVPWDEMYRRYGQPNDLLVTLNIQNFSVRDVPVRPVYGVGEISGLKIKKVVGPISTLLLKRWIERVFLKYVVYDFHPLVFFLLFAILCFFISVVFFINAVIEWFAVGTAPLLSTLAFLFTGMFSFNSMFFSLWMDMEANRPLRR